MMQLSVVNPTQRHRELVADLAAHGSWLGELEMMRVGRGAAADQARLRSDKPPVRGLTGARRALDQQPPGLSGAWLSSVYGCRAGASAAWARPVSDV